MEKTKQNIIRIAVTGPECSGKTWMCRALAAEFNAVWITEYSREYLDQLRHRYTYDDLEKIARGHAEQEAQITRQAIDDSRQMVFTDTEFINMKIWSEYRYNKCSEFILEGIRNAPYHHYLLMKPDIPWVPDPYRKNPHDRDYLFDLFEKELKYFRKAYTVIQGNYEVRIQNARSAIQNLLSAIQ